MVYRRLSVSPLLVRLLVYANSSKRLAPTLGGRWLLNSIPPCHQLVSSYLMSSRLSPGSLPGASSALMRLWFGFCRSRSRLSLSLLMFSASPAPTITRSLTNDGRSHDFVDLFAESTD